MNEMISMTVPDQPLPGSVVLDAEDWAWQRLGGLWRSVRPTGPFASLTFTMGTGAWQSLDWPALLAKHGPVTVVHVAEKVATS